MTRIIRSGGGGDRRGPALGPKGTRIIRAAQQDALRESEELIAAARARAKQVLDEAAAAADRLRERALAEGRREALRLLAAIERQRQEHLTKAEPQLIELALRIAEKILGAQLALQPESVRDVVARCMQEARGSSTLTVRVNPADLALLEQDLAALRAAAETDQVSLEGDPSLRRGGCIIETPGGQIDGRIDAQLDAIREGLAGES
jgi:type III secretion protein L